MANKKSPAKKKTTQKTVMIKIAEKVGELAARIVNEKEHLVERAGTAIKTAKATLQNATTVKKAAAKKSVEKAAKKIAKPAAKKVNKASKKAVPVKKTSLKKAVKKK